jgi:hypothetical protein
VLVRSTRFVHVARRNQAGDGRVVLAEGRFPFLRYSRRGKKIDDTLARGQARAELFRVDAEDALREARRDKARRRLYHAASARTSGKHKLIGFHVCKAKLLHETAGDELIIEG